MATGRKRLRFLKHTERKINFTTLDLRIHLKYHKESRRIGHKLKENICNTYNQQRISTQDTYESIRKRQSMEQ